MPNNGREGKVAGRTLVAIVAVFLLAFAFLVWGDSGTHIASNPGPSGMPESTIIRLQLTGPQERQPEQRASAFRYGSNFATRTLKTGHSSRIQITRARGLLALESRQSSGFMRESRVSLRASSSRPHTQTT